MSYLAVVQHPQCIIPWVILSEAAKASHTVSLLPRAGAVLVLQLLMLLKTVHWGAGYFWIKAHPRYCGRTWNIGCIPVPKTLDKLLHHSVSCPLSNTADKALVSYSPFPWGELSIQTHLTANASISLLIPFGFFSIKIKTKTVKKFTYISLFQRSSSVVVLARVLLP